MYLLGVWGGSRVGMVYRSRRRVGWNGEPEAGLGGYWWSDKMGRGSSPMFVQATEAQHLEELPHVYGAVERYFIESWVVKARDY